MKRAIWGLVLLTFLPAWAPSPAESQVVVKAGERGWIGISYAVTPRPRPGAERSLFRGSVTITRVYHGSPAAEAGLEAGDTILTLNGVPATAQTFEALELAAGEELVLTVRRSGGERELRLTAEERPAPVFVEVSPEQRIRIDSVRSAIFRFIEDSTRVTVPSAPLQVRFRELAGSFEDVGQRWRYLLRSDSARGWTLHADSVSVALSRGEPGVPGFETVGAWLEAEGRSFPFTAFVIRSEKTDSILDRIRALQEELEQARRAELQRQRELAEALVRERRRIDRSDEELQRARERQTELTARLAEVREVLEQESRRALEARRTRIESEYGNRALGRGDAGRVVARLATPHMVGRTVVAGAQLLPLNRGLGEYFGTDRGVLVTEVVPGSPAEAAEIRPGDVLVEVAQEPVHTVAEVRTRLARPDRWPVEITLLRKGRHVTVRLSR